MYRLIMYAAMTLAACSGGDDDRSSGLESSRLVIELTSDDLDVLCGYIEEITGPERTFTCDGVMVKSGVPKQRCIDNAPTATDHPSCTLTVGQLEDCYEYTAKYQDDPCDIPASNVCDPLAAPACN